MMAAADVKCVVCEKCPAVLYCQQDDAHLCVACDEQVHSANQLASRHQRVPIVRAAKEHDDSHFRVPERTSVFEVDPAAAENSTKVHGADAGHDLGLDDDSVFAVPDIDLPGFATDDVAPKVALGKQLVSDDFDLGDLDPLWLDRLDVGIDRLPSDLLDSLVPEAAPPPKPPSNPPRSEEAPKPEPKPQAAKQQTRPSPTVLPPPPVHMNPHMMHPYPGMQWVPYAPAGQQQQPMKLAEVPLDIENYIPHSLLPVDAATHAILLRTRREKLERFREKKRNRLFKKTIRYASRKAYAEVRPRIKGRFARKDEVAAMRAAGILPGILPAL